MEGRVPYEPGLTNSLATFQTMMNNIFQDLILSRDVMVYLDNILIAHSNLAPHHEIIREVLWQLRGHRKFEELMIEYLGVIISHNHVEMDPVKVTGVAAWLAPKNKKDVQQFLGFTKFCQRFIRVFSDIAQPLFNLAKKGVAWTWTAALATVFQALKDVVTTEPVLVLPDESRPYWLEVASSDWATRAVLSQQGMDGKWCPIPFYSRGLNDVQRNYVVHDKEMLAIVRALEEWQHFLKGAQHPVEIWMDHKNLEYFQKSQKLNRRQARWSLYLSWFDFALFHQQGRLMGRPDMLSSRLDHGAGSENLDVTLLWPELFWIHTMEGIAVDRPEIPLLCDVRKAFATELELEEPVALIARELLKNQKALSPRSAEWKISDELLLFHGKIIVPRNKDLCRRIMEQHHDTLAASRRWSLSPGTTSGPSCPDTSASTSEPATCATG
jgi:hypothetical protein